MAGIFTAIIKRNVVCNFEGSLTNDVDKNRRTVSSMLRVAGGGVGKAEIIFFNISFQLFARYLTCFNFVNITDDAACRVRFSGALRV